MKFRYPGRGAHVAMTLAMWPVVVVFSPVILLAGEQVNRYVMRRLRRSAMSTGGAVAGTGDRPVAVVTHGRLPMPSSLLLIAIRNPLWIALTAPGRWVADKLSTPPSPGRRASAP